MADFIKRMHYNLDMQRGFTLVELSLVLVILGLIVGGILGGQSLIKSAQLRAQLKDFEMISAAHFAFREQYNCAPGDCRNANSYFPSITNGNGNGQVEIWPSSGTNEGAMYFLTLEEAGLLEARRSPISAAVEYRAARVNSASNYSYISYFDRYPGGGYSPATLLGSGVAWINFANNSNSPWADGPSLIPEQAWNYDVKVDDGKALSGQFLTVAGGNGVGSYHTTCIDGSGNYVLATTTLTCRLLVKIE